MGQFPVKNFIFSVLHLQIGLGNYFLRNLLYSVDSDVENLSTGEEVARNTLLTLNQVITKIRKKRQIWAVNYGLMLLCKAMQIKWLQDTK